MPARIQVGSCSWTDPTLIACGRFYPPGITSAEARLRYYAEQFDIVEVDSTYYAPPSPRNSELWAARTPPASSSTSRRSGCSPTTRPSWGACQTGCGTRSPGGTNQAERLCQGLPAAAVEQVWELHREALEPLAAAGKLGAVLFQFPPWFVRSHDNRAYLRGLPHRLPGWPLAVEFRGGGWMDEESAAGTLRLLEEAGLAYVAVDEPQGFPNSTPPLAAATAPLAVVRLHGRNAGTWESRTGAASDRFKYLYADGELEEWVPRVRELAAQTRSVHVLFNNNYEDWGMQNARRMAHLLGVERQPPQTRLALG